MAQQISKYYRGTIDVKDLAGLDRLDREAITWFTFRSLSFEFAKARWDFPDAL